MKGLKELITIKVNPNAIGNTTLNKFSSGPAYVVTEAIEEFKEPLDSLNHGDVIVFISDGKWNSYDLLRMLLNKTGPAALYLVTWSITEKPIRILSRLKDEKMLTAIYALVDFRIRQRNEKTYQFLCGVSDQVRPVNVHAKVMVLVNEHYHINVISSLNFTKNPRKEGGTILWNKEVTDNLIAWIKKELITDDGRGISSN